MAALGAACEDSASCDTLDGALCADGRCQGGPSPTYLQDVAGSQRMEWRLRAVLVASPDGRAPVLHDWRFTYYCCVSI